ncbi:MAG: baseplate J/gp47 family protein [Desulfobulbaceae bacterium]|nr:baseplate J/gp47 family protein [Desulfobulbaceae bacterium]
MKRPVIRNLIQNDGLTQPGRFLKELEPLFARIDDRSMTDLLSFAWKYSDQLVFYEAVQTGKDEDILPSGTWQQLLRHEQLFSLALISRCSPVKFSREFEGALDLLDPLHDTDSQWQSKVCPAFNTVVDLCVEVAGWLRSLAVESKGARDLKIYISQLESKVEQLLALYSLRIFDDKLWQYVSTHLKDWNIDKDGAPVQEGPPMGKEEVVRSLRFLFGEVQTIYAAIVNNARQSVDSLLKDDTHQAHIGLFLAFLRLLENNRDHLNKLTARHLDFYLRDILQLKPKDRQPDSVNLIFEPAKKVDRHRLACGTAFKGGKNEDKIERLYDLKNEVVVSRAAVAELKNIHVVARESGTVQSVHTGSVANSLDGLGEPLPEDSPKWPGFGTSGYPFADLGFVVSSPLFRLSEGERDVTMTFAVNDLTPLQEVYEKEFDATFAAGSGEKVQLPGFFSVQVSTAKGWYDCLCDIFVDLENRALILEFAFAMDVPAIVDYDAEKLADKALLPVRWPVFHITVNQQDEPGAYDALRRMKATRLLLEIQVEKVRSLVLASDAAKLKPDKPFLPFGSQPRVGSSFFIGHGESFAKPLTEVTLSWQWVDPPQDLKSHYSNYTADDFQFIAEVDLRENYNWDHSLDEELALSKSDPPAQGSPFNVLFPLAVANYDPSFEAQAFSQYSDNLPQGGLRLRLKEPSFAFGHKAYPMLHSKAVAKALHPDTPDSSLLDSLELPYTPMFENFELSYRAAKEFKLSVPDAALEMLLLRPFGHSKPDKGELVANYNVEGSLSIGISGLALPGNLSLLIQLAEGSGDPFLTAPQKVSWEYLTDSGWQQFTDAEILRDGTLGFLQSGIMEFSLPKSMSDKNSEMPKGFHWLRAVVSDNTAALHDVLAIIAQAGVAVYRDEGHKAAHLATALPAGSVAKMLARDTAIKTVSQPFASYGGREAESDSEFHTRCSERLRHKDRAVTLWDYEHLVLERFPEVHKVKCLNHTCPDSEFSPGNVMLVLMPDLRNRNNRYPLRPAVAQSVLEQVKKYIQERCSVHVAVHVVNPYYERIAVGGVAHFREGYDQGIYQNQLWQDITNGLTPWQRGEKDIHFGGRIHSSVILNLVEELPYVDYISEFTVTHYIGPDDTAGKQVDEVIATSNRSILVSNATHTIQGVTPK